MGSKNSSSRIKKLFESRSFKDFELTDCESGSAKLKMNWNEDSKNVYGTYHGGDIYKLGDSAAATAAFTQIEDDEDVLTSHGNINYLGNTSNADIIAEAQVRARMGNEISCDVYIHDTNGRKIADGKYVFSVKKTKR